MAISLAALTVVITPSSATAYEGETKLSLTTDYLFEKVTGGHWLRLNVTLDDRFRGKGTLEIDPNTQGFNKFGDPTSVTEIATKIVNITLEAIKLNDPAKKGRQIYEIKGVDQKVRLFLVVSPKEVGPSRLIVCGDGKSYVLPLQSSETWESPLGNAMGLGGRLH